MQLHKKFLRDFLEIKLEIIRFKIVMKDFNTWGKIQLGDPGTKFVFSRPFVFSPLWATQIQFGQPILDQTIFFNYRFARGH